VFENRVLTTVFGPRREEVARRWRRLRNEELHNLYVSRNITRVINSRRIRWSGHVARVVEMRKELDVSDLMLSVWMWYSVTIISSPLSMKKVQVTY